jgi:hypothetical protein
MTDNHIFDVTDTEHFQQDVDTPDHSGVQHTKKKANTDKDLHGNKLVPSLTTESLLVKIFVCSFMDLLFRLLGLFFGLTKGPFFTQSGTLLFDISLSRSGQISSETKDVTDTFMFVVCLMKFARLPGQSFECVKSTRDRNRIGAMVFAPRSCIRPFGTSETMKSSRQDQRKRG